MQTSDSATRLLTVSRQSLQHLGHQAAGWGGLQEQNHAHSATVQACMLRCFLFADKSSPPLPDTFQTPCTGHTLICADAVHGWCLMLSAAESLDKIRAQAHTLASQAKRRKLCCCTGLMNTMFMKPGGVLLQLLPYGFTLNETTHQRIRGDYFVDMIQSLNGTYMQVGGKAES